MAEALRTQQPQPDVVTLAFDERLSFFMDGEWADRRLASGRSREPIRRSRVLRPELMGTCSFMVDTNSKRVPSSQIFPALYGVGPYLEADSEILTIIMRPLVDRICIANGLYTQNVSDLHFERECGGVMPIWANSYLDLCDFPRNAGHYRPHFLIILRCLSAMVERSQIIFNLNIPFNPFPFSDFFSRRVIDRTNRRNRALYSCGKLITSHHALHCGGGGSLTPLTS